MLRAASTASQPQPTGAPRWLRGEHGGVSHETGAPTPTSAEGRHLRGSGLVGAVAGDPVSRRPGGEPSAGGIGLVDRGLGTREAESQGQTSRVVAVEEGDGDIPGGERGGILVRPRLPCR